MSNQTEEQTVARLSGKPEERYAMFTESAATLRKFGYEEQAKNMERIASAPEETWVDVLREILSKDLESL